MASVDAIAAVAFVLGFGFMRSWALTYLSFAGVTPPVSLGLDSPLFVVFAPVLLGVLAVLMYVCAKRRMRMVAPWALAIGMGLLVLGTLLLAGLPGRFDYIAHALSGVGFAFVLMQWGSVSVRFPIKQLAVQLSLGFVVAGLLCYGLCFTEGVSFAAAFAAFGAASSACLACLAWRERVGSGAAGCSGAASGTPACEGASAESAVSSAEVPVGAVSGVASARTGRQMALRLCAAMFVMELAARSSLMLSGEFSVSALNYSANSFEIARLVGTFLASLVLIAVVARAKRLIRILYMLTSVLLITSCMFLAFWANNLSPYVTYVVAFSAGAWLETAFWVLLSQSHKRLGVSGAVVWGGGRVAFWASTFCGAGAWSFLAAAFHNWPSFDATLVSVIAAMALCVVVTYVFILPPSSTDLLLGEVPAPRLGAVEPSPRPFRQAIDELAEGHGLSRRETEVFELLAKGRDTSYIQNELCISAGTVSSHRDRIYKKLGVHSKQELIDLVEESRRVG